MNTRLHLAFMVLTSATLNAMHQNSMVPSCQFVQAGGVEQYVALYTGRCLEDRAGRLNLVYSIENNELEDTSLAHDSGHESYFGKYMHHQSELKKLDASLTCFMSSQPKYVQQKLHLLDSSIEKYCGLRCQYQLYRDVEIAYMEKQKQILDRNIEATRNELSQKKYGLTII